MSKPIPTDECLVQWAQQQLSEAPLVQERKMFGCPAFFVERRMFACVYQGSLALKLPESRVSALLAAETATTFQPYGKPKMREWCALAAEDCELASSGSLLLEAFEWARAGHPSASSREVAK